MDQGVNPKRKVTIPLDHPVWVLRELVKRNDQIKRLFFLDYHYSQNEEARDYDGDRDYISVAPNGICRELLSHHKRILGTERDLAVISRVQMHDDKVMHIPMIDFKGVVSFHEMGLVKRLLVKYGINDCAIYWSGHSFHFYGLSLIEGFIGFMDDVRMLGYQSIDPPYDEGYEDFCDNLARSIHGSLSFVTDYRWASHSVMQGYGSLRLTCNQDRYAKIPRLVYRGDLSGFVQKNVMWP